ncbi:MAG: ABC transporter permease [Anaerolineae bacterium]
MQQTLLIARREFSQRIRQRGFVIMSVAVPLIFLVIGLVAGAMTSERPPAEPEKPAQPVGYVDQADFVYTTPDFIPPEIFRPLPNVPAAEAALARGDIAAYFIIAADYRESGQVQRVSPRLAVNAPDVRWFNQLLMANLPPAADPAQLERLIRPFNAAGPEFMSVTPAGEAEPAGNPILPFLVTMAIVMPLFTGAGYLFQSMAQEKSNRVVEILLVSLRPRQLLTGKILGLGALTLVQYLIWGGVGLLALAVTGRDAGSLFAGVSLSPGELVWLLAFALAGFLLYAALMAGIGALARDVEDGRIWLFVISLPLMIPIYLWSTIAQNPDGLIAVTLSLIPFSAPVAMLMRLTAGSVPAWQVAVSWGLLLATGLGTIWLMGRLFRTRTLLSGETISARRVWAALRG